MSMSSDTRAHANSAHMSATTKEMDDTSDRSRGQVVGDAGSVMSNSSHSAAIPRSWQSSQSAATNAPSQPSLMYRKNFGKTGIYVPPKAHEVASSNVAGYTSRLAAQEEEGDHDVITRQDLRAESLDKDEADNVIMITQKQQSLTSKGAIPLTGDRRMMSMESRPFDESLPQHGPEDEEDIEPPSLRKTPSVTAPVSPPVAFAKESPRARSRKASDHSVLSAPDRFNMPPPRVTPPSTALLAQSSGSNNRPRPPTRQEELRARVIQDREPPEEDDSLFDFKESSAGRRARFNGDSARRNDSVQAKSPSTLAQRSREAWDRKNSHKSNHERRETSPVSIRSASVSFDKQKDTIQYYEPDDAYDNATLADRSLNSEYTKSAESEVEDLLKDIFMLGSSTPTNPGRRKVKYSSSVKDRVRSRQTRNDDDDTYETNDDSEFLRSRTKSPQSLGSAGRRNLYSHDEKDDDDNPLAEVWNYMEGGIKSVGLALGLTSDESATRLDNVRAIDEDDYQGSTKDIDDAQDFWLKILGKSKACTGADDLEALEAEDDSLATAAVEDEVPHALSLEEDMRLVDLALQAARSVHLLKILDFDESYEIDIATDIHFSVVDLLMPFGLIFQENPTGVWITKVLSDGSAAKTNKVQIGDQLAAVDGLSAINMKVDEISSLIRKKRGLIELTFLRYIGPLRPATGLDEEGYEVKPSIEAYRARPVPSQVLPPNMSQRAPVTPVKSALRNSNAKSPAPPPASAKKRFRLFGFTRPRK